MLDKEYRFFEANREKFLEKYKGKVLVIIGEEISGVYDDEQAAYDFAIKNYKLGSFLIQKCLPEKETVQTFYSRAVFAN